jgi:hypothetical protein
MQAIDDRIFENLNEGGVRPSSRPHEYFIYCVGQDPDRISDFLSYCIEHDIGVKPLYGQYKGQTEESFISNWKDYEQIKPWLNLQESILFLYPANIRGHRKGKLVYMDGSEESVGYLREVTRQLAITQPSWTYDPYLDTYYICM